MLDGSSGGLGACAGWVVMRKGDAFGVACFYLGNFVHQLPDTRRPPNQKQKTPPHPQQITPLSFLLPPPRLRYCRPYGCPYNPHHITHSPPPWPPLSPTATVRDTT